MTTILQRAADRGECTLAGLSPRVIALPVTLIRYEALLTSEPVPDSTLTEIVDDIFLPCWPPRPTASTPADRQAASPVQPARSPGAGGSRSSRVTSSATRGAG